MILDQTKVSDRHQILMLSVRWGERALPLAWQVAETERIIDLVPQKELLEVVAGWQPADLGASCSPTASPQPRDDPVGSRSGMGLSLRLKSNLVARWGTTTTTTDGRAL